jgi:hypothetical protein
MPRRSSSGGVEVGRCGASRDGRQSPAQPLERALLGEELWGASFTRPEFLDLKRESLDPPNKPDDITSLGARLQRAPIAGGGHQSVLLRETKVGKRV